MLSGPRLQSSKAGAAAPALNIWDTSRNLQNKAESAGFATEMIVN